MNMGTHSQGQVIPPAPGRPTTNHQQRKTEETVTTTIKPIDVTDEIHTEVTAGRIHPRIAEQVLDFHMIYPDDDIEELLCRVISAHR